MIRKAEVGDVQAITALLRGMSNLFSQISAETPVETQQRVARHLTLCLADDSHSVYVAESAIGDLSGYVSVHWLPYLILAGPEGYVSELFIAETCRGQGVGRQLLDAVVAEARERGCARLMLLNMRHRESYQRQFYSKQGWKEREEAANFVYPLK